MAKQKNNPKQSKKPGKPADRAGTGGELHRTTDGRNDSLTTNQGVVICDNQNSLSISSGARGPTLLEDFILREKITHVDRERVPERIVHARGSDAHGHFQAYRDLGDLTCAAFLAIRISGRPCMRASYAHLKIIGFTKDARPLLDMAGMELDDGTIAHVEAAKNGRLWARATLIEA